MKFIEFKNKIEETYKQKFPASTINCQIFKCLGRSITIDCYIAADEKEVSYGIWVNDIFSVSFIIHLPDEWTEFNDLPEIMTLSSLKNGIRVKPTESYLYCNYKKPVFRKTKGDPEKIVKTFSKYVDRLYSILKDEYQAKNLLPDDMKLVRNKSYF